MTTYLQSSMNAPFHSAASISVVRYLSHSVCSLEHITVLLYSMIRHTTRPPVLCLNQYDHVQKERLLTRSIMKSSAQIHPPIDPHAQHNTWTIQGVVRQL